MLMSAISARAFPLHHRLRHVRVLATFIRFLVVSTIVIAGLGACEQHDDPPKPGQLTLTFTPAPPAVPNLTLDSGTMHIERINVLGDAPPPMHMPPVQSFDLDVLSPGTSLTFTMLPPGVYSRVQLMFSNVQLQGSWRGTPFSARVASFRPLPVDLRSATGKELAHDENVSFTVGVDVTSWFAANLLDSAAPSAGQLVIDEQNNGAVGAELMMRIGRSFSLQ
ncbi:MAG: hypothetical protein JWN44_2215 [Myxococcales bacterium]|nr:hypothetical protein [Myxococcales bacterium]